MIKRSLIAFLVVMALAAGTAHARRHKKKPSPTATPTAKLQNPVDMPD